MCTKHFQQFPWNREILVVMTRMAALLLIIPGSMVLGTIHTLVKQTVCLFFGVLTIACRFVCACLYIYVCVCVCVHAWLIFTSLDGWMDGDISRQ
jgi:hypothetical protein